MSVKVEQIVMKLFRLDQKNYFDFTSPDAVNTMLVSAETEVEARVLAEENELEHRDGEQLWGEDHATCVEVILPEKKAGVYLVS